jgi:hypothetical protein
MKSQAYLLRNRFFVQVQVLACIREASGSNIGRDTSYSEANVFRGLLSPFRNTLG